MPHLPFRTASQEPIEESRTPGDVSRTLRFMRRAAQFGAVMVVASAGVLAGASAQPASLSVEELFRLGDDEGEPVFGSFLAIAADADGRIYVADLQDPVIRMLSGAGEVVATIGGPGEGPGEFSSVSTIRIGPDGTVYAYDSRRSQVTAFKEVSDGTFAFEEAFRLPMHNMQLPGSLLGVDDAGMIVWYISPMLPGNRRGIAPPETDNVVLVGWDGSVAGGSLAMLPVRETLTVSDGGRTSFIHHPFGPKNMFTMSPSGRLYSGRTDAIRIQARSISGDWQQEFSRAYVGAPLSQQEIDAALNQWSGKQREAVNEFEMPDSRPPMRNFVVDDKDRLWIQISATDDAQMSECIVMGPDGADIAVFELPTRFTLGAVRGDRAVGRLWNPETGPLVIAYSISE